MVIAIYEFTASQTLSNDSMSQRGVAPVATSRQQFLHRPFTWLRAIALI
jgi:hypothetical protein